VRLLVPICVLLLLCGCPDALRQPGDNARLEVGQGTADVGRSSAWLDPDAKVSTAIRLTSPAGIDVRQAAYWQPAGPEGTAKPPLQVLLRTRDYTQQAEEGTPDPQRIALLDLLSGETKKLDENMVGLPIELAVSPNHNYAVVAQLESRGEKQGYSLEAVNLRAYGYGGKPVELRPQPSVIPWVVLDNGQALCRIVRGIVVSKGLPAVGYDWASGTQLCNVREMSFVTAEEPAVSGPGNLRTGYNVSFDPALPDKGKITYWLGTGGRNTERWELPYFGQSAPFEWRPPLRWLDNKTVATVTFLPRALGGEAGLFRIVALEGKGESRLIEDRATPDISLVAANGVLLYAMRGGVSTWSVWAASADGMRKQRVWAADNTVFLEVLDVVDGRRVLVHRQYFGADSQLHSDVVELSLDPLQATKGKPEPEEVKALPSPKAVIEDAKPAEPKPAAKPEDPLSSNQVLFPPQEDSRGDGGSDDGGFIPDNPGGPPPIAD
jgi:hypothetical protein